MSPLGGCLKNGRDRFASGHAMCASRSGRAAASGPGIPQRSGEWEVIESEHEKLGNRPMFVQSLFILADRPEVGPCLRAIFRQHLSGLHLKGKLPATGINS